MNVAAYWEDRYRKGKRGSGAGSRGDEAKVKAAFVNALIARYRVRRVIDWGCGDGVVASLIRSRRYIGLDVSESALALCRERVRRARCHWLHFDGLTAPKLPPGDLALSLDVIFHLVDDELYRAHLALLFGSAPLVAIHSSNRDEPGQAHVLHREFLPDVPPGWRCVTRPDDDAAIGFWVFEREEAA
jgi:SAM-dependent methyltransferase